MYKRQVGSLLIVLANLCADLARPLLDRRLAATGRRATTLSDHGTGEPDSSDSDPSGPDPTSSTHSIPRPSRTTQETSS